ncbi:MAG: nucleotidyl transferase AbiEii/AbiGii toxin family protein [Chlamydiia bacterium]|nr:nucleotidyl transferase AbiEii/AbiGii toxin family protein [Chlamydiia bacterium]
MDLIHQRIRDYQPASKEEELNAYKEICQEIALAALARANFFQKGAFQGGTCLRIVHQLDRFSEDLDFVLEEPDPHFQWTPYLHAMESEFAAQGLNLKAVDRSKGNTVVKKAFLKDDSFGQILTLNYPRSRADNQTIRIKLEIDTNPPKGSKNAAHVINYPFPFSLITHDLPTLFSGKCVALLCREYVKGRDWYDFLWYMRNKTLINYPYLKNALAQNQLYTDLPQSIDRIWLLDALSDKIRTIDWEQAKGDTRRFIRADRQHVIDAWSKELFLQIVQSLLI